MITLVNSGQTPLNVPSGFSALYGGWLATPT